MPALQAARQWLAVCSPLLVLSWPEKMCQGERDGHPVPFLNAQLLERPGHTVGQDIQVFVGQGAPRPIVSLPVVGHFGLHRRAYIAVETIVDDVELATHEPLEEGGGRPASCR